jgi:hypothetical protein
MMEMEKMVKDKENQSAAKISETDLEDPKINVRIILAASWISHFLLWTFGDMVALLQHINPEPISDALLTFVAAPLAMTQAFMIVFSLIGEPKWVRWLNIGVAPIFILFNIGYLSEGSQGWNYVLGLAYIMFNVVIIWYAWNWPNQKVTTKK